MEPFPFEDRGLYKHKRILDLKVDLYRFDHIFGKPFRLFAGAFDRGCLPNLVNNQLDYIHSFDGADFLHLPNDFQILLDVRDHDLRVHVLRVHDRDRDVRVHDDLKLNEERITFFL